MVSGQDSVLPVQRMWVPSLGQKIPWRRKWQPTPAFLPGEFYGQKSLVGYSPWGLKESDMTEYARTIRNKASVVLDVCELVDQLKFNFIFYCFDGEGNGNPLQYSFLENSMDRGA